MFRLVTLACAVAVAGCARTPVKPEPSAAASPAAPASAVPPVAAAPAAPPVASGATRAEAVARMRAALAEQRPADAVAAAREAWEAGERTAAVLYDAGCAAALAGEQEEALVWLGRAADAGFDRAVHLTRDPDLASLRELPGFARVAARVRENHDRQNPATDPALRDALLERVAVDQEARFAMLAYKGAPIPDAVLERLRQVDRDNIAWMKGVVARHGWPGRTLVGISGANAAWLLVQHADQDRAFQRECLARMERQVAAGEASGKDFAYLTDRVLVGEGRPQRFGTQFAPARDGVLSPQPVEDPEGLDARRAAVGLKPMAEYAQDMARMSGRKASPVPLQGEVVRHGP